MARPGRRGRQPEVTVGRGMHDEAGPACGQDRREGLDVGGFGPTGSLRGFQGDAEAALRRRRQQPGKLGGRVLVRAPPAPRLGDEVTVLRPPLTAPVQTARPPGPQLGAGPCGGHVHAAQRPRGNMTGFGGDLGFAAFSLSSRACECVLRAAQGGHRAGHAAARSVTLSFKPSNDTGWDLTATPTRGFSLSTWSVVDAPEGPQGQFQHLQGVLEPVPHRPQDTTQFWGESKVTCGFPTGPLSLVSFMGRLSS